MSKITVLLIVLLVSCTTLHKQPVSYHSESRTDTILYQHIQPLLKQHPNQSGIVPLISGQDALEARIRSIRDAQHSIDIQYYIWKDDFSGLLLLKELMSAAERGVRVRLLLDNFYESRYQKGMKILDQSPGIEVRLIDTNFKNFNHRMHNKSFTVDNQLSIVGGRNIGDEYFEISKEANFKDYDVLMIGPVVEEVSVEFDQYWNSKRSLPVSEVEKNPIEARDFKKAKDRMAGIADYQLQTPDLLIDKKPFWSEAHIVYDPPAKLEGSEKENLSKTLRPGLTGVKKELILISPYLIPGRWGMKTLKKLKEQNVRIVILTNSLFSTDVLSVYSGYKKYRKDLLKMGVELYELKAKGVSKKSSSMGSSGSTGLHGKVMISDRIKMFVGSMNLDPRSRDLNTEMGVVINSPQMAHENAESLLESLPFVAYRVELHNKKLRWIEQTETGEKVHSTEPGITRWVKFKSDVSSWVIPEQML